MLSSSKFISEFDIYDFVRSADALIVEIWQQLSPEEREQQVKQLPAQLSNILILLSGLPEQAIRDLLVHQVSAGELNLQELELALKLVKSYLTSASFDVLLDAVASRNDKQGEIFKILFPYLEKQNTDKALALLFSLKDASQFISLLKLLTSKLTEVQQGTVVSFLVNNKKLKDSLTFYINSFLTKERSNELNSKQLRLPLNLTKDINNNIEPLLRYLTEEQLEQIVHTIEQIPSLDKRNKIFDLFFPYLSDQQFKKLIDLETNIQDNKACYAVLASLTHRINNKTKQELLDREVMEWIFSSNDLPITWERLESVVPFLSQEQLEKILTEEVDWRNPVESNYQTRLDMGEASPSFTQWSWAATQLECDRSSLFPLLAPYLSNELITKIFYVLIHRANEAGKLGVIQNLIQYLNEQNTTKAWEIILSFTDNQCLIAGLEILGPYLKQKNWEIVLQKINSISDSRIQGIMLSRIIHYLPDQLKKLLPPIVAKIASNSSLPPPLFPYSPEPQRTKLLHNLIYGNAETLDIKMDVAEAVLYYRDYALLYLEGNLQEAALEKSLELSWSVYVQGWGIERFLDVLPYLNENLASKSLKRIYKFTQKIDQLECLKHLIPRLDANKQEEALNILHEIAGTSSQLNEILLEIANALDKKLQKSELDYVLNHTKDKEQTTAIVMLAPLFNSSQFSYALETVSSFNSSLEKVLALLSLARVMDNREDKIALVEKALSIVQTIPAEDERLNAILVFPKFLEEDLLNGALEIGLQCVNSENHLILLDTYGELKRIDQIQVAIADFLNIFSEQQRHIVLNFLAKSPYATQPYFPESILCSVMESIKEIQTQWRFLQEK
jgi:hypothetical protein